MSKIKNLVGNIVFSEGIKKACVSFDEDSGLIVSVSDFDPKDTHPIDYFFDDDCLIFPGMGDIHIHAREDVSKKNIYKEDFHSSSCAAINGGVVHVGDMPNNPIPPIDDLSYQNKVALSENAGISFLMYAGIGPHTRPLSVKVPYKAFMGPSIGDLFFETNEQLEASIAHYENQWVSFHCEDPIVLAECKNAPDHFKARPIKAENLATTFALKLIEKYNLKGKLCHYSSGSGLTEILKAKDRGVNVLIEVTPQHLFFSEEKILNEYPNEKTFFQMNPPIRSEADRLRMLEAFKAGKIDFLATDHAPHSREEKLKGTSGMPGLDTFGPFVTWLIVHEKMDPTKVLKFVSTNPGDFFNEFLPELKKISPHYEKLGKGYGHIASGYFAAFTVLNLKKPTVFGPELMKSKAHWSPFFGVTFPGSVEAVFIAGKVIKS